jgi:hypothetical protein
MFLVLGMTDYENPVFVLDLRREELTKEEVKMADEDNKTLLYDELPPQVTESLESCKETST